MSQYPHVIQQLITQLAKLPTIGPKTAERIVFMMLKKNHEDIGQLGHKLIELSKQITRCGICKNITSHDPCLICTDNSRDHGLLCVVAEPQDLEAIEHTHQYNGKYFVLQGTISTYYGRGPDDIGVNALSEYLRQHPQIHEVILALDPDIEGETTMMYIHKALQDAKITISRLARGLPVGADLEYADEITLTEALRNRKKM